MAGFRPSEETDQSDSIYKGAASHARSTRPVPLYMSLDAQGFVIVMFKTFLLSKLLARLTGHDLFGG